MREGGSSATRLFEIAEQQAGYFAAAQALEVGYSYASQSYHHKVGNWVRDGWRIYCLARYAETHDDDLILLMLLSRDRSGEPQAVLSHDSALHAFGLSGVLPAKHHLTVP